MLSQTAQTDASYSGSAPILLIAEAGETAARARRTADASGLRAAGPVPLSEAAQRIALQARASALWLELDGPIEAVPDALFDRMSESAAPAIVATTAELIDPIVARLGSSDVTILVNADDSERAAALALALARDSAPARLSDVASDNSARLRQLSDEVNRIAATLARLSSTAPAAAGPIVEPGTGAPPEIAPDTVRSVVRARRLRSRYFPDELFADPAWDMLLDLLQAELSHVRVPVSSLCIAAAVPATTALRWLKAMVDQGIFLRRADPHDGRRVFVELAPDASLAMRRYFAEVDGVAVI